jgi:hypothetical protein
MTYADVLVKGSNSVDAPSPGTLPSTLHWLNSINSVQQLSSGCSTQCITSFKSGSMITVLLAVVAWKATYCETKTKHGKYCSISMYSDFVQLKWNTLCNHTGSRVAPTLLARNLHYEGLRREWREQTRIFFWMVNVAVGCCYVYM